MTTLTWLINFTSFFLPTKKQKIVKTISARTESTVPGFYYYKPSKKYSSRGKNQVKWVNSPCGPMRRRSCCSSSPHSVSRRCNFGPEASDWADQPKEETCCGSVTFLVRIRIQIYVPLTKTNGSWFGSGSVRDSERSVSICTVAKISRSEFTLDVDKKDTGLSIQESKIWVTGKITVTLRPVPIEAPYIFLRRATVST